MLRPASPPPTVADVDQALHQLLLDANRSSCALVCNDDAQDNGAAHAAASPEALAPGKSTKLAQAAAHISDAPTGPDTSHSGSTPTSAAREGSMRALLCQGVSNFLGQSGGAPTAQIQDVAHEGAAPSLLLHGSAPRSLDTAGAAIDGGACDVRDGGLHAANNSSAPTAQLLDEAHLGSARTGLQSEQDPAPAVPAPSVDDLFLTPPLAVLQLPTRRTRPCRAFDMNKVRRSARLAKKPVMPAIERAQRNLWRKLGVDDDEMTQVLQDFISMYHGALPDFIVAAMTALFDLDDDATEQMNDALLQMVGDAVEELQHEQCAAT
uniref:Uncharacterized protein n=1 Tax=Setaria viridis TaxID=4556 RepID=A0A4U6U0R0_SETVI|nr:hypothetical protein SEVIR_6G022166v2 [Setaria viridis]